MENYKEGKGELGAGGRGVKSEEDRSEKDMFDASTDRFPLVAALPRQHPPPGAYRPPQRLFWSSLPANLLSL